MKRAVAIISDIERDIRGFSAVAEILVGQEASQSVSAIVEWPSQVACVRLPGDAAWETVYYIDPTSAFNARTLIGSGSVWTIFTKIEQPHDFFDRPDVIGHAHPHCWGIAAFGESGRSCST
jgi:hypothetical protein